ncbi:CNT_HP2_G0028570.mRNA.1.CDS.1 [Saccharomyces cerevisiae]|nr:CNT_HP2_G0028570.mRNA.1.CDS.1 [Saccharomyces cerevisiae]CAI6804464.1 CNT_HP2_G0028570.mRNA.1.CDS.1 [Saccharomyces cerevisiae]
MKISDRRKFEKQTLTKLVQWIGKGLFEKLSFPSWSGKSTKFLLTFVEDEPNFQATIPSKYLIPKKKGLRYPFSFTSTGHYNEFEFPVSWNVVHESSECQAERQLYDAYFH